MINPETLRHAPAAEDLAVMVYDYTSAFPREERYGLAAQMRRAAISIGSNVFEGAGKQTNKAFAASLYVSFSEAGELLFQLRVALRLKFGDEKQAAKLRHAIERIRQRAEARSGALRRYAAPRSPAFIGTIRSIFRALIALVGQ